jgi:ribosomal protein S27AE
MRAPKERFDFIQEFLKRVFGGDLHAKRILCKRCGASTVIFIARATRSCDRSG